MSIESQTIIFFRLGFQDAVAEKPPQHNNEYYKEGWEAGKKAYATAVSEFKVKQFCGECDNESEPPYETVQAERIRKLQADVSSLLSDVNIVLRRNAELRMLSKDAQIDRDAALARVTELEMVLREINRESIENE